jgi:hypothetical protein
MQNHIQQPILEHGLHVPGEDTYLGPCYGGCCGDPIFCKPVAVISANIAYLFIFALAFLRTEIHKTFDYRYYYLTRYFNIDLNSTGPSIGEFQGFDVYLFPLLPLISVMILNFNYRFKFLSNRQIKFLGYSIFHFLLLSFNFVGYLGNVPTVGVTFALLILFGSWVSFFGFLPCFHCCD